MTRKITQLLPTLSLATLALLTGCIGSQPVRTLDSLDLRQGSWAGSDIFVEPRSEDEVRAAYDNYIQRSSEGESGRLLAIQRLAELEISRLNKLTSPTDAEPDDSQVRATLERSRDLLQISLREFPKASNRDETLYQLARILDQLGEADESAAALAELAAQHPKSRHYPEVQFRLAESAFVRADYLTAEDAYSEVLFTDERRDFYERALFKRGWARYKQGLYTEAIDDFLAAIKVHPNKDLRVLLQGSSSELNEYYRGLGLALANFQDLALLQFYFAEGDEEYLYPAYLAISNVYLEQERYSDAAATLQRFAELNPDATSRPLAELQILNIWRRGSFMNRYLDAVDTVYQNYHPDHSFWEGRGSIEREIVAAALREIALEQANYFHAAFANSNNDTDFSQAERWYEIYLKHYSNYARQDKVYTAFAELLAARQLHSRALHYFELAAYDGDIILDKEAAYATIALSSELLQAEPDNSQWLDKQVHYALLSARLYPLDKRYQQASLHAAEKAYQAGRYDSALQLIAALPQHAEQDLLYQARTLEGLTYRDSGRLKAAEQVFSDLLKYELSPVAQQEQLDNLALAIYQQAQEDLKGGNQAAALEHYARIAHTAGQSSLAPSVLHEQILLAVEMQYWQQAIQAAETFKTRYPKHELINEVSRQASVAYLHAGDTLRAAQTFEQLAQHDDNREVQMTALWQAAELYESRGETEAAIRSYRSYAHSYTRPYPQYIEAMHRLTELYKAADAADKARYWQEKIAAADGQTPHSEKTARSNYLSALTLLDLGNQSLAAYAKQQLKAPLADNLRRKKQLLEESTRLLARASSYGFAEISTEATHAIGSIYQDFAKALLESERPAELTGEELAQYDILLEDQAFPFEEKAIEFYEMNLARVRDGIGGEWIAASYQELAKLFPARYARQAKVEIFRHD